MIKYNNSNINGWNYGDDNIVKVYRNGAVVYYKVVNSGSTPTYQVCYAVVDDISQYSDREFEDVYNKADSKWYKLNNLNQYEEYGVYGDSIATSGTSKLPQGYTEVEYIRNNNYNAYINTSAIIFDNTANTYTITTKLSSEFHSNLGCATIISCESIYSPYYGLGYRYYCASNVDQMQFFGGDANYSSSTVDNGDGTRTITFQSTGNTSWTTDVPLSYFCSFDNAAYTNAYRFADATIYSATVVKNGVTIRDFVPAKRNSDSVYGLYDLINDVFYTSPNGNNFSGGSAVTPTAATYYQGKLAIVDGYEYKYSGNSWVNVGAVSRTIPDNYVIPFEDATVKSICVNNWGGNVVTGELTYGEAKAITSIGTIFANNTSITKFNELAYFKGLTTLNEGNFAGCTNLTDIVIPSNVTSIGRLQSSGSNIIFRGCSNLSGLTLLSGEESLYFSINAENDSYYMNSSHSSVPMVFPDRPMEFSNTMFAYYDYLTKAYFQSSSPPTNFANSDINNSNKLSNVYCPVGSLSAYQTALSGKGKTITEYDFETDSLGLLDKEKEWTEKTNSYIVYPIYYVDKSAPPNNLTFSSMTEANVYAYNNCVYDGMKATIDGTRYIFSGDSQSGYEWVEDTNHYLPDLPFSVNYNAKNYNPNTKTLIKTIGQLVDVDAVITAGTPTVNDGYLTITSGTRATISGYQAYFNRENAVGNKELTIVSKQSTDGSNCHMFANRDGDYNWMYRCYNNKLTLHGTTEKGSVAVTTQPVIESVRVYSNSDIKYNNYTDNTSSSSEYFAYGSANNGKFALFQGYGTADGENFIGDFYWVYMSQNVLTDEQIQQVIDYNENL